MKTKIVYVLVSEETDYYYEMVMLSLYSLRLYHPQDTVELVMDEATNRRLVEKKASILDNVTPIVVPIPPEYTKIQRSRFLKTRLRQIVRGDFFYLDCDTIVCEALDEIDKVEVEIGMVSDANGLLNYRIPYAIELCDKAGFPHLDNQPYYNGGVLYVKDSPKAYQFFETWHQLWKLSVLKNVSQDQPALCMANFNLRYPISELPEKWNWQIRYGTTNGLHKAKIFHFFSPHKSCIRNMIYGCIRQTGGIKYLENLARNPRTIGLSIFTISDDRLLKYICTDHFYAYDTIPKLYRILSSFSHIMTTLYCFFSRITHKDEGFYNYN